MPTKLIVGLSRKVGLPDFGSSGASCHLEIDATDVDISSSTFQQRVSEVYDACRHAVDTELNGARNDPASPPRERMATEAQVKAIYAIARRQSIELDAVVKDRFGVARSENLNVRQASALIDHLKSRLLNGMSRGA